MTHPSDILRCFSLPLPDNLKEKYDIYIDTLRFYPSNKEKIYIICEPSVFMPERLNFLEKYNKEFKLILTFDVQILNKYNNAKLLLFGTTWIPKEIWNNSYQKENKISFWVGHKLMLEGHHLRQNIFKKLNLIKNIDLYLSKHHLYFHQNSKYISILGDSKLCLFEKYKFHLCIENCRMENYFTEKIMDCFLTKTIPIYWGCLNISQYFNPKGIVILNTNNLFEIINIINNLSFDMYEQNIEAINENHKLAQKYTDYSDSVINAINMI